MRTAIELISGNEVLDTVETQGRPSGVILGILMDRVNELSKMYQNVVAVKRYYF